MSQEQFQEGARACLAALRQCEAIGGADGPFGDEDHFEMHDRAVAAIVQAAGPLAPKAAGALQLLAELFVNERLGGGELDLDRWQPEACMSAEATAAARREINEAAVASAKESTVIDLAVHREGARGKRPPAP